MTPNTRMDPIHERLTLLLDADDTLWENNIYFIEVTEEFVRSVTSFGVEPKDARRILLETELHIIEEHGYGSRSFSRSVEHAYRSLANPVDESVVERLCGLATAIFDRQEMELRPDAAHVLRVLAQHHRMILVTKGDKEEQERKLELSGLREHFEWVEVVAEKNTHMYEVLIRTLHLDPARTWMIGNSPKSDINPAMAAGLQAIFIPHPQTWEMEFEEIRNPSSTLLTTVDNLSDLLVHFAPNAG